MAKFAGRRFVTPATVETQVFDWGTIKWLSEPRVTGTDRFTMGVVLLQPGKGHSRHNHPGTEEILYDAHINDDNFALVAAERLMESIREALSND